MRAKITANDLQYHFPKDTVWKFDEIDIQGFSISNNLFFFIEEGMKFSGSGKWMVNTYKVENPPVTIQDFLNYEIAVDQIVCIKEEYVNFKKY